MALRSLIALFVFLSTITIVGLNDAEAGYKGRLVKGTWKKSWDDELKKHLFTTYKDNFLGHHESQIEEFCPGYGRSERKRKIFWHQLFLSLAWKESLHGPRNYVHFNGGKNIGLYQINPVLRRAYNCRGYDLYDPISNIRCGVKMARHLINRDGSFFVGRKSGMAAYWQPLRATNKLNRRNRAYIMRTVTNACAVNKVAYISTDETPTFNFDPLETYMSVNTISDLPAEDLAIVLEDHPSALHEDAEAEKNPGVDFNNIDRGKSSHDIYRPLMRIDTDESLIETLVEPIEI